MYNNINTRNLFITACVIKVVSSFASWYFNSPWILGFTLPLLVMCGYMWLGATRRNGDVSKEKFADSCYYLGFIFTITSISVALMDLPNIGIHIQDIAVRFGAAMLSTVLGLSVRVAMVTFRKDLGDAINIAQESVVEVALRFRDQLHIALDHLKSFEVAVDHAARMSVVRVNLQVENLSKNHADNLTQFFAAMTKGNQEAFTIALEEVKGASARLSKSMNGYALGMGSSLARIEGDVVAFSDVVTSQLKDISENSAVFSTAIDNLRNKASTAETAFESVTKLAAQQQFLMNGAQGQLDQLERLGMTLQGLNNVLAHAVQGFQDAKSTDADIKEAIRSVISNSEVMRKEVCDRLKEVADVLVTATKEKFNDFDQVRAIDAQATHPFSALDGMTTANLNTVVEPLDSIVRHPEEIDALTTKSADLRSESPPYTHLPSDGNILVHQPPTGT